jgi:NTP pyrophosphatase (non-canonical NTP hydrolase)
MHRIEEIMRNYSFESQVEIFIEECSEAIQAAQKMKRARESKEYAERCENFIEEIADVIITVEQMKMFVGKKTVDKAVEAKINRQLKRIEEERRNTEDGSERVSEEI